MLRDARHFLAGLLLGMLALPALHAAGGPSYLFAYGWWHDGSLREVSLRLAVVLLLGPWLYRAARWIRSELAPVPIAWRSIRRAWAARVLEDS